MVHYRFVLCVIDPGPYCIRNIVESCSACSHRPRLDMYCANPRPNVPAVGFQLPISRDGPGQRTVDLGLAVPGPGEGLRV